MNEETVIKYKDLSVLMKAAVIGGLASLLINGIAFLVGFVEGVALI